MKKQMFFGICCTVICLILVACINNKDKTILTDNTNKVLGLAEEVAVSSVTVKEEDDKTFMEVVMIADGRASGGCETWKKDEEITFTIKSNEKTEIEIGILPVLENGDYGRSLSEVCEVEENEKKISIKVPDDGDYGICFINKGDHKILLQVELNKVLENPFI